MRFMILVKATRDSEAGAMPPESLINEMAAYHEELAKAGVLVDGAGLRPSAKGLPVRDLERSKTTEVLLALSCASKEEVDGMVASAAANGGKPFRGPQDHGFMYQHAFEDPDGHVRELVHMRGES